MTKLPLKRIFLTDDTGKYYRIFSVANQVDYKGEYYVKVVFPDAKGIPLTTGIHDGDGTVTSLGRIPGGVHEFSYHYRSGISHFKDSGGHIDSKKNLPTLFSYPALHLIRFVVRSLGVFEVCDRTKVSDGDFVLPNKFDGRPRGFELALSRTSGPWAVTNTQGDDPVYTYKFPLEDTNVSFHIADCVWTRSPIVPGNPPIEFFRYDDPTNNFEFKEAE